MILYHGTHKSNKESILKNGIQTYGGFVSLTPRPDVARGYASMSGEKAFRKAGRKARTIPLEDRLIVIVDLPNNIKYQIRGAGLLPGHEYRIFELVKPEWIVDTKLAIDML